MDKNDWVYLAGFIDGEGNVGIDKYNKYGKSTNYAIKVAISNTNREILEWIQSHYGGHINTLKRKLPHHKECYQLTVRHLKAYRILKDIEPYLKIKQKLACIAIRVAERCQVKYNHKSSKPLERQIADEADYQLVKSLIGRSRLAGRR
uniref:Putative homing endonuclease n=1 Tax=viral metagenome TaxID=1070528 RepID=A0A6H1ZUB2_9ZZZZ